jgi:signal transduction histidine kinase
MYRLAARSQSPRFLLYLEWVLLAIVALSELPLGPLFDGTRHPGLNLLCLGLFAALGWQLPQQRAHKLWFTGIEFGLIGLMSIVGGVRLFVLLYLVLVLRNCLLFAPVERRSPQIWQRWGITLLALLCGLVTQGDRLHNRLLPLGWRLSAPLWNRRPPTDLIGDQRLQVLFISFAVIFGLVVIFLHLLVEAVLAERQSRDLLAAANARLRDYAFQMEHLATTQERSRIAREIHDSLGHSLTVFNVHLAAALRLLDSDPHEAKALIIEAKQLGATALQEVRQSVTTIRSDPLQGKRLEEAIATLAMEFQRSTGVQPECQIAVGRSLPHSIKTAIYRIVQESLTNIYKYAEATHITVTITTQNVTDYNVMAQNVAGRNAPIWNDVIQVIVTDNGKGFESAQNTTGFGLQGMQERILALNGEFELLTAPGQGCQIRAWIPCPP